MKKETRVPNMDHRQLEDILTSEIDRLYMLRDGISSSDGRPLNSMEKEDIRNVLGGRWLKDMNTEAAYLFREGNTEDFNHNRTYVTAVLKQFS